MPNLRATTLRKESTLDSDSETSEGTSTSRTTESPYTHYDSEDIGVQNPQVQYNLNNYGIMLNIHSFNSLSCTSESGWQTENPGTL